MSKVKHITWDEGVLFDAIKAAINISPSYRYAGTVLQKLCGQFSLVTCGSYVNVKSFMNSIRTICGEEVSPSNTGKREGATCPECLAIYRERLVTLANLSKAPA